MNQEDILYGTLSIAGKPYKSGSYGVSSFNGRTNDVVPMSGDYNYEMVNAFPATEVLTNSDILEIWNQS